MWAVRVVLQRPYSFVVLASLRNPDEALGDAFSSVAARRLIRSGPRGGFAIDPDQGDGDWSVWLGMACRAARTAGEGRFRALGGIRGARRGRRHDERPAGEVRRIARPAHSGASLGSTRAYAPGTRQRRRSTRTKPPIGRRLTGGSGAAKASSPRRRPSARTARTASTGADRRAGSIPSTAATC